MDDDALCRRRLERLRHDRQHQSIQRNISFDAYDEDKGCEDGRYLSDLQKQKMRQHFKHRGRHWFLSTEIQVEYDDVYWFLGAPISYHNGQWCIIYWAEQDAFIDLKTLNPFKEFGANTKVSYIQIHGCNEYKASLNNSFANESHIRSFITKNLGHFFPEHSKSPATGRLEFPTPKSVDYFGTTLIEYPPKSDRWYILKCPDCKTVFTEIPKAIEHLQSIGIYRQDYVNILDFFGEVHANSPPWQFLHQDRRTEKSITADRLQEDPVEQSEVCFIGDHNLSDSSSRSEENQTRLLEVRETISRSSGSLDPNNHHGQFDCHGEGIYHKQVDTLSIPSLMDANPSPGENDNTQNKIPQKRARNEDQLPVEDDEAILPKRARIITPQSFEDGGGQPGGSAPTRSPSNTSNQVQQPVAATQTTPNNHNGQSESDSAQEISEDQPGELEASSCPDIDNNSSAFIDNELQLCETSLDKETQKNNYLQRIKSGNRDPVPFYFVYEATNAKIIGFQQHSELLPEWYILYCEERGWFLDRWHFEDSADIKDLVYHYGIKVIGCDCEKAEKNNAKPRKKLQGAGVQANHEPSDIPIDPSLAIHISTIQRLPTPNNPGRQQVPLMGDEQPGPPPSIDHEHHQVDISGKENNASSHESQLISPGEKLVSMPNDASYPCSRCNRHFRKTSALSIHLKSHRIGKPYKCRHCLRNLERPELLTRHEIDDHPEINRDHICLNSECDLLFSSAPELHEHQTNHPQLAAIRNNFVCYAADAQKRPDCSREWPNDKLLTKHMQTHNGIPPFRCKFLNCNWTLFSAAKRIDHYNSSKHKYPCMFCGENRKGFADLATHIKDHLDDGDPRKTEVMLDGMIESFVYSFIKNNPK